MSLNFCNTASVLNKSPARCTCFRTLDEGYFIKDCSYVMIKRQQIRK